MAARKQKAASPAKSPALEWAAAGVGLFVALGLIGFVGYEALSGDSSPPDLSVQAISVEKVSAGHLVTLKVENTGGQTAAQVVVEGTLGEEVVETTFDYVPDHSSRTGGLIFQADPRTGALDLRAKGYADP